MLGGSGVSDLRVPSPAASRILARSSRSVSRRSVNSESTRAIVFVAAAAKDGNIVTIHFDCKVGIFTSQKVDRENVATEKIVISQYASRREM